jgi:hypothetical protein
MGIRARFDSGFGLIGRRRRDGGGAGILFQIVDDLQDAVAADDGIVGHKFQGGRVFQDHGFGDLALKADAMFLKDVEGALLLTGAAEDTDENHGGFEVAADVNVIDRNEADFIDIEFTPDGLAKGALQKFPHTFMSEGGHKTNGLIGLLNWRMIEPMALP